MKLDDPTVEILRCFTPVLDTTDLMINNKLIMITLTIIIYYYYKNKTINNYRNVIQ